MNEAETKKILISILTRLDIQRGDTVYLGTDMSGLPLPNYPAKLNKKEFKEREKRWCEFLLQVLLDYLGPKGTLLAPAFTYSCSAPGSIFTVETTPAEVGPFTRYLSIHPLAHRSIHPLFSISGIGYSAKEILENTGKSAFGAKSVFGKLNLFNCKFLCIGTSIANSLTYIHHLEQTYGCNGRYNKVFHTKVMKNSTEIPGPWLAYVAYRSINHAPQCDTIENQLRKEGKLNEVEYESHPFQSAKIEDVNTIGYNMLEENQCSFRTFDIEVVLDETESSKFQSSKSVTTLELSHTKHN